MSQNGSHAHPPRSLSSLVSYLSRKAKHGAIMSEQLITLPITGDDLFVYG